MSKYDSHLKCSFCGKSQENVRKLIAGPGVYICNECVDLCNEILLDEDSTVESTAESTSSSQYKRIYSKRYSEKSGSSFEKISKPIEVSPGKR